jgi:uncharacterized protein (TIGR02246 family)
MRFPLLTLLALALIWPAGVMAANAVTESDAVKSVVDDWVRVWETKDTKLFSRIMAHDPDMVAFGTDSNEHFVGWDALRDFVSHILPSIQDAKLGVTEQVINVRSASHVAWFTELVAWDYVFDGKHVHQNCRFSGVLEKRHGEWVIVHFHNSVPDT